MSYRFTVITEFLYTADVQAVAKTLSEGLGAETIVGGATGRAYVAGWFKSLSPEDAKERFDNLSLPVGFVVLTEWGECWHKPAQPSDERYYRGEQWSPSDIAALKRL